MHNTIILRIGDNIAHSPLKPEQALAKLTQAMEQQDAKTALDYAQQITTQAPHFLPAYTALYRILRFTQNFSALETAAKTAIQHNPKHALSYQALAQAYRFQRKAALAIIALTKAVQISPNNVEWRNNLAIMHKEQGDFSQALSGFERCITQYPNFSAAYWHRSDITPHMPESHVKTLVKLLANQENTDDKTQVYGAYALFKHFESNKDYQQAFAYLTLGAKKQRQSFNYNHDIELFEHENIAKVFDQYFFEDAIKPKATTAIERQSINSEQPIFICGLPRSGTTLAEQIISSHNKVAAGDELFELAHATQTILQKVQPKKAFPFWADELKPEHWRDIGKQYLTLTKHINTKEFFTDKMPLNYKAIGLIHLALPKAKIIYCLRPPMDLLLGAYKQILDQGNKYTYDLDELTSMIIAQDKLMKHWQTILGNKIFILDYKMLVTEQEKTTRALLEFLNLPWQEQCLQFHKNNRTIHTLSNAQVRKPLFSSSLNAWHNYYEQLKPYANKMKKAGLTI